MKYVIFSIDNVHDLHTLTKFTRYVDTLRAMGYLKGDFKTLIGSYKGSLEYCFLCDRVDFDKHVLSYGYVDDQESFLSLSYTSNGRTAPRALAKLWHNNSGDGEYGFGEFKEATKSEAMDSDGWTYDPTSNKYFIVEQYNDTRAD
jgi:hypothetical protein